MKHENDPEAPIPREQFEAETTYWLKTVSPKIYKRIMDVMARDGIIKLKTLPLILDAYKYMPIIIHKNKNDSEQFRKQVMIRDVPIKETPLQRNFLLLGDRVEDKFKQMTKAYRFFDTNKVNLFPSHYEQH